jgi:hypothetical protein
MHEKLNNPVFHKIALSAHKRVKKLNDVLRSVYITCLVSGLLERNPELRGSQYLEGLFLSLSEGIKDIFELAEKAPEDMYPKVFMLLIDDLLGAFDSYAEEFVVGANQTDSFLSKENLRQLDLVFRTPTMNFGEMCKALEEQEKKYKKND